MVPKVPLACVAGSDHVSLHVKLLKFRHFEMAFQAMLTSLVLEVLIFLSEYLTKTFV